MGDTSQAPGDVDNALTELRELSAEHLDLGKFVLQQTFYPLDFLAVAVLNRSLVLLHGFADLLASKRLVAAAPLVRLQLDNALRFSAAWLVPDPHQFAIAVLGGSRIDRLKDREGKRLSDSHLMSRLKDQHPWIEGLYQKTSGYVHLSEAAIFNAVRMGEGQSLRIHISQHDQFIPDRLYLEAVDAFRAATMVVFRYVHSWAYTKNVVFPPPPDPLES
jgi:hypothetical protein